nr:hypothetical protein [Xanthomonas oryzae]
MLLDSFMSSARKSSSTTFCRTSRITLGGTSKSSVAHRMTQRLTPKEIRQPADPAAHHLADSASAAAHALADPPGALPKAAQALA